MVARSFSRSAPMRPRSQPGSAIRAEISLDSISNRVKRRLSDLAALLWVLLGGVDTAAPWLLCDFAALDFANDAEAEIVAGIIRRVRGAGTGAQIGETRFPTAAAINTFRSGGGAAWIHFRRAGELLVK